MSVPQVLDEHGNPVLPVNDGDKSSTDEDAAQLAQLTQDKLTELTSTEAGRNAFKQFAASMNLSVTAPGATPQAPTPAPAAASGAGDFNKFLEAMSSFTQRQAAPPAAAAPAKRKKKSKKKKAKQAKTGF